jgi:hypothetical protein
MATLHRIPVMQGDTPQKAKTLTKCEWCNKPLAKQKSTIDHVAECVQGESQSLIVRGVQSAYKG